MRTLCIKNIGPVREAVFTLRRYNFFIGPQSCGKSTIAKIISNCVWLEKEIATHPNRYDDMGQYESFFIDLMEEFHYMKGYLRGDSWLEYRSDFVRVVCEGRKCYIALGNKVGSYERQKILYIPAERIIFSKTTNFPGTNNLNSFALDWINARDYYDREHQLRLLALGIDYYSRQENGKVVDRIVSADDNGGFDIKLVHGSSGLQSVIPLASALDFYSSVMYRGNREQQLLLPEQTRDRINVTNFLKKDYDGLSDIPQSVLNHIERLTRTKRTYFIIEEPELNLYPDTQKDLLNYIIKCSGAANRRNSVTITTHSPYIINQLNLLVKAYDRRRKVDGASIDFDDLNVFAVGNGTIRDLKVANARLIDTAQLSEAINETYDRYDNEVFD